MNLVGLALEGKSTSDCFPSAISAQDIQTMDTEEGTQI